MKITEQESFWVSIMRMNKAFKTIGIEKSWKLMGVEFTFTWRSKDNLWGRFGGGWNWELGFQASGSTIILLLLICSLKIYWGKK